MVCKKCNGEIKTKVSWYGFDIRYRGACKCIEKDVLASVTNINEFISRYWEV